MLLKLIFIAVIIIGTIAYFKRRWAPKITTAHRTPISWYQAAPSLFTPAEQLFLSSLEQALQDIPVKIFGKVHVADILKIRPGIASGDYHKAMNQISTQQVDFLLIDSATTAPLLVIQLENNNNHNATNDPIKRAPFIAEVLYQAQIPILSIPLRPHYNEAHLRSQILDIIR